MVLAESETMNWIQTGLILFDTVFSAAISVYLYRVSEVVRRHEKHEENREDTVHGLRSELHAMAIKIIDERFKMIAAEVESHARSVIRSIEEIKSRLKDGDGNFEHLAAQDHQLELKVIAKFETVKDWLRDTFAGKAELRDHERSVATKLERLDQHIGGISTQVAVLSAQCPNCPEKK